MHSDKPFEEDSVLTYCHSRHFKQSVRINTNKSSVSDRKAEEGRVKAFGEREEGKKREERRGRERQEQGERKEKAEDRDKEDWKLVV